MTGRGVAVAVLACSLALGCTRREPEMLGQPGHPVVLVLSPAHGTPEVARDLGASLARQSGLAIEVKVASSPDDAVGMLGSPQVDGGIVSLFEYLLARQEFGVQAAAMVLRGAGQRTYAGVILVRADGTITTPRDLAGKRVAFVDPRSTTGYLLAARSLAEAGVNIQPVFVGSHAAAIDAVRSGRVDAAATFEAAQDPDLRVLARTGEVPNEPVVFRAGVPIAVRQRIVGALTSMAGTEAGRGILGRVAGITGFIPAADADYADVGRLLRESRQKLEDLVPGGWQLVNERRRPLSELGPY